MHIASRSLRMVAGLLLAAASLSAACAAGGQDVGSGGEGGVDFLPDGGNGGTDGCALYELTAEVKPVNLYIMFDKSSSMAGNKWNAAKSGLTAFVEDEGAAGLKVALRFFPRPADATPACDQQAYKDPVVDFTLLPDGASAIVGAIEAESPDGFSTPIYPALGGALLEGIEVAENNAGEVSAVLLVTDGAPEGPAAMCNGVDPEDPQVIADLAATGASFDPPVATYVVGLPGVDQSSANLIAAAGGTDEAILVGSSNVEAEFQDALAKVRGDALPCSYEVPEQVTSGEVSLGLVNVEITEPGGDPATVPYDPSCDGVGWHFDDQANPTSIELCSSSCQQLKANPGVSIRVVLGCTTAVK
ncbi:MAG TPA: VWA domain-containing protein [Polyangiaceae bacterium]|nr:VWA domain-containing protein [Polyangiaceae bacterium]